MQANEGTVFWITGLSGSGKTTIGHVVADALRKTSQAVVFLDGDQLREITGNLYGREQSERLQASLYYARLCKVLAGQGINVVCATISLFHETQNWNRKNIANYIEVFLDVPLTELMQRDIKNIYANALNGKLKNVVGIDISPEFPERPDIIIKNVNEIISPARAAENILHFYAQTKEKFHAASSLSF